MLKSILPRSCQLDLLKALGTPQKSKHIPYKFPSATTKNSWVPIFDAYNLYPYKFPISLSLSLSIALSKTSVKD